MDYYNPLFYVSRWKQMEIKGFTICRNQLPKMTNKLKQIYKKKAHSKVGKGHEKTHEANKHT